MEGKDNIPRSLLPVTASTCTIRFFLLYLPGVRASVTTTNITNITSTATTAAVDATTTTTSSASSSSSCFGSI